MKRRILSMLLSLSMASVIVPTSGLMTAMAEEDGGQSPCEALGLPMNEPTISGEDPYGSINGSGISMKVNSELYLTTSGKYSDNGKCETNDYTYNWEDMLEEKKEILDSNGLYYPPSAYELEGPITRLDGLRDNIDHHIYSDTEESAANIVAFDPFGDGKDKYIARHIMSYGYEDQRNYHEIVVQDAKTGNIIDSYPLDYIENMSGYLEAREIHGFLPIVAGDFDGDGCDEIAIYNAYGGDGIGSVQLFNVHKSGISRYRTLDIDDYCEDGISGTRRKDEFVQAQLTAGKLLGNSKTEDLIVTLNYNSEESAKNGRNGSRVLVYDGNDSKHFINTGHIQNIGDGKTLRAASTAIGDVDGDGKSEIVIAGHRSKESENKFVTDDNGDSIEKNFMAVFKINNEEDKLVHCSGNEWKLYDRPWSRVGHPTMMSSVALTTFAAEGKNTAEYVFMDGMVYKYNSASGSFDKQQGAKWERIHEDWKDDHNFINRAIAANLTNDDFGRETVVFTYNAYNGGGGDNKRALGIGSMFYNEDGEWEKECEKLISTKSLCYADVAVPDYDDDGILIRPVEGKGCETYFTDPKVVAVLQAAPRFSELDVIDGNYATEGNTSFGKSESTGTGSLRTIEVGAGVSVGFEYEASAMGLIPIGSFETSASFTTNFCEEFSSEESITVVNEYGSPSDEDRVVLTSVPYTRYFYEIYVPEFRLPTSGEYKKWVDDLEDLKEKEDLTDEEKEKYYALAEKIQMMDDSGKDYGEVISGCWQDYQLDIPAEPNTVLMTVDEYDRVASGLGWNTLRENVLPENYEIGEPSSYLSKQTKVDNWLAGGLDNKFEVLKSGGGTVSQAIEMEKSNSKTTSLGVESSLEVVVGVAGFKFGVTGSLGNTNGFTWTDSSATTYAGTVRGVPTGYDNYKFKWQFGTYTVPYSYDGNGNDYDCRVLGYLVDNLDAPPSTPKNFEVSDVTENTITLSWENGLRSAEAYNIAIYDKDKDEYTNAYPVDADQVEYTIDSLSPGTEYSYAICAVSDSPKSKIVYSDAVTAKTKSGEEEEQAFNVDLKAENMFNNSVNVEDGGSVTLYVEADKTEFQSYYEWQVYRDSKWIDIEAPDKYSLTLNNLTKENDGEKYRCSVKQLTSTGQLATVCSNVLTVNVGKKDPSYEVPTGITAYVGDTLADVTLPEGFVFEEELITSVGELGENTFKVTFTPEDTVNYNTVSGIDITITVDEKPVLDDTIWGDVDENQTITTYDATLLARYLTLSEDDELIITSQGLINADVTHDGDINMVDLVKLKKFLVDSTVELSK